MQDCISPLLRSNSALLLPSLVEEANGLAQTTADAWQRVELRCAAKDEMLLALLGGVGKLNACRSEYLVVSGCAAHTGGIKSVINTGKRCA